MAVRSPMHFLLPVLLGVMLAGCSRSPEEQTGPAAAHPLAFLITLGQIDTEPARWDGSLSVTGGKPLSLTGWRFYKDDQILPDGKSWKCATRRRAMLDPKFWWIGARHLVPASTDAGPPPGPMIPNGVFVTLEGGPAERSAATIQVSTARGSFAFSPDSVPFGRPAVYLDGNAVVERTPAPLNLTGRNAYENDHPAVAIDAQGRAWTAWISYAGQQEQVYAAPQGEQPVAVGKPGVYFRTALARYAERDLWLVASSLQGETWNLVGSRYDGRAWSAWQNIALTPETKMFHRLARDSAGRLWLAWQGWLQGKSVIRASVYDGKQWSEPANVSANTANAWEPSMAADPHGRMYFAWDAYDNGSYNIYFTIFDGKRFLPPQAVTASARFHAHASIESDAAGRPWIAWEEAGANWGKDTGFLIQTNKGEGLYEQRAIGMAVQNQGVWMSPARPLEASLPLSLRGFNEQPLLVRDKAGRMWCFFRHRSVQVDEVWSPSLRGMRLQDYSHWEYLAASLEGENWSPPIRLPHSSGRNDFRLAAAAAPDGQIVAAWAADGRTWAKSYPPVKNNIFTGRVLLPAPSQPARLVPRVEEAAPPPPVHPRETQQREAIQSVRSAFGGKTYRIARGDMHRHTDISFDGDLDGSIWDFYRYTIDAAGFEYSALTEHNSGDDNEYFWWIIQKSNDLFYLPHRFTPIYAYERSLAFPNGHRNILFARRGVRTLPRTKEELAGTEGAAKLYQYLRKHNGLAMSHTSATRMGTDWRDNDPELEPLVEIYQGDRTSYEYEGAPRAARGKEPFSQPGGYAPEGFVWNAWAKGLKLGVQASSDHYSTHVSYACLLVENISREGILEAIRKRRAYAATDNIILDFRLTDPSTGDHLMGEAFTTSERPKIICRATGTAPIAKIELIKNNKFIYSITPKKEIADFTYEDKDFRKGESYYYVRLQQTDGQIAWSSPVWVTRE